MTEQIAQGFALLGGGVAGVSAVAIVAILWAEWRDRDE